MLGGTLDLGLGFVGVGPDPDEVVVVPQGALDAAGVDPAPWWPAALDYLERMGTIAAQRLAAEPGAASDRRLRRRHPARVARVPGSLCAAQDGTGMRAAAVPMRRRGWLDLTRIDPAFTAAAAAATAPEPSAASAGRCSSPPTRSRWRPRAAARPRSCCATPPSQAPHLRPVLFR